ncbi:MAG: 50S ribosomal protein L6 [Candidatus Micrarchaeota archaeon]|nr:50S ribosomal protein L6 [Candidatus Micrarchaeota archaeon]
MDKFPIPSGINVEVKNGQVVVTGKGKTFEIAFDSRMIKLNVENGEISFNWIGKETKRKVACMRSVMSHVKNAFKGIDTGFSKKLQVVYSHFPVSIEVKDKTAVIKNFLGEKVPRLATIIGDSKVEVKGQDIAITGSNKYEVGQTANNLMAATKIKSKDRRVFQDGIYPVIA